MARISTYNIDTDVSKTDKLIGTDASFGTKNFDMENIAKFLNTSSLINVNGQIVYKYSVGSLGFGEFNIVTGGPAFSSVTKLRFSHFNSNQDNISTYLNYFDGLFIILTQTDNQNIFAQYEAQVSSSAPNSIDFSLNFREGNGVLTQGKHYALSFSPKGQTDKNFTSPNINFQAGVAKTIAHNLSKFPAVTTVDSAGSHIVGEIQHTDNNNLTLTFKASFQGKVYVN
jgi:hypothetical protein